jgi:hypothetical protein
MHSTIDPLVFAAQEAVYRETVEAAGKGDLLVQVFTDAVGHCVFTPDQLVSAVTAMESWLDTGTPPGPQFFPAAQGFVRDFEPPAWPFTER